MSRNANWIAVEKFGKQIGAIGFIGDKAAVVAAFYDDYDGNMDGKLGLGERIAKKIIPLGLRGSAITEVAMQARAEYEVIIRDPSFHNIANNLFLHFAKGLLTDGIYAVYFSQAVSAIAKPIAGRIAKNIIVQFAIRKGMEEAVKKTYINSLK